MKKIDKLILKSFLGPLLLTFAIAVFVLLMQFVWKYIDDLVGTCRFGHFCSIDVAFFVNLETDDYVTFACNT